jgi:hypothetical protein
MRIKFVLLEKYQLHKYQLHNINYINAPYGRKAEIFLFLKQSVLSNHCVLTALYEIIISV